MSRIRHVGPLHALWIILVPAALLAATPGESTASDSAGGRTSQTIEEQAARAVAAFKAGEYESALAIYRNAEAASSRADERAALRMNVGACLTELHRLEEAKRVFLSVAELDAASAQKARLNAALIAVELNQLDEAEQLVSAAQPVPEAMVAQERDVRSRIAEKRAGGKRAEFLAQIELATQAIRTRDWARAKTALTQAQSRSEAASVSERVDVLHSLGIVQLALDEVEPAKKTLGVALELAPNDADVRYALARAHQASDDLSEARAEYRHALQLGLTEPNAAAARKHIESLAPLGSSEWFGWVSASSGYDSNPRQSGAATETALGRRGQGGSAYGRVLAELGRTQRIHDNLSLRLRYAGDWLGFQKKAVQDLSLQNHGVFFGAQWAPIDRLILGVEVGPSILYIGLNPISRFSWDLGGSLRARYLASNIRTWRVSFDFREINGATDWDFLSGSRLDAEVSHGWSYSSLVLRLGMRARWWSMGTRTTMVDSTVISACTTFCEGAEYRIPLSYAGMGPVASARVELLHSLYLATLLQFDWRQYSDDSFIVGVDPSRKRRVDRRYTFGADLQWALDERERFMIVPSYALLVSSSNMALSSTNPNHIFDYDDRRFLQHFIELGVEASF